MKKSMWSLFSKSLALGILIPGIAFAAEEEGEKSGIDVFIHLLILVIVGGILYNLWASVSGFGGQIGKALKLLGWGVLFISVETIDKVIEEVAHVGSEDLLGVGILHDVVHDAFTLAGFLLLAWGLTQFTKIVKGVKS